ncbi:hypothetical protein [Gryllotalpicola protaetiae]|uniref:Protein kinase domain-containing protein n=1 Tax=Gryllotalpicola protaetiae TaxID=2419771 RepID=A0A387BMH7_9MICO|nr:hypothetical protein [Gryllotalpicola protaetiae]AYG05023.1 hypothetical protein D7I44_16855 [Gryllotalpicola protaetiae]
MTDASAAVASDAVAFGRRAAALIASESAHLPRVLDVTVLGERRELQLHEVAGPALADVLARRRRLPAGEAVTIVISAARAVAALHSAGFCCVALDAGLVRFDHAGTPLILGLDDVREIVLAGAQGTADDWRAVADLADRLGLIAHGRAGGALGPAQVGLGLALATLTAGENEQTVDRLEAALFELAEPEPVQLSGAPAAHHETAQSPLGERRVSAAHRRPSGSILIEAFDAGPAALLAGPLARLRARTAEVLGRIHGRGRLLLIAGAAAAALTFVAVALLPGDATAPAAPPRAGGGAAVRSDARTTPSTAPTAAHDAALFGADPVAAASVLLAQRDGCLDVRGDGRAVCLARVADGQASALDRPARPLAGLTPSLLERTGDSALIALTPNDPGTAPASALLMRTEAGWKLRQLYEN